ncbi:homocysteine S-methyltransferase family protein [Parablautia sp. Marseille-Q6255]|uniref:homocysteine S-methyltransferase family protein n=1 Tax=Parablautia sp. Marseille-Q6255 TaxID=3039593 RepID=UPI002F404C9A
MGRLTKQGFKELVQQGTVLLDGATGSNLRNAGMPVGICAEQWILEHPEVMKELQRAYVEAGSQILYAPTFSGNRISLALHGLQERLTGLNTKLVELSQEASGGRAYVAGDMTTTGKLLEPRGDISYQELYEVYQEQARVLISAGVDLIVAETMMNVDETVVLLDAVQSVAQIPVMCTLTVEADGSALYGGSAVEAVETLQEMGADAVGINCSVGPDQLEAVVASMYRAARIPVIAKPNAGIPVMDEHGQAHYSMGPEQFAVSMKRLVENGARIVGGCCGTTPEYISLLAQTLRR